MKFNIVVFFLKSCYSCLADNSLISGEYQFTITYIS